VPPVRLAAIDVGSNSVHVVVADVSADGRVEVVDRVKEMVRLAATPSPPAGSRRRRWIWPSAR